MVPVTGVQAWTAFWGLMLGFGLWTLAGTIPRLARPQLMSRVAPYLMDVSDSAREWVVRRPIDPLPVLGVLVIPGLTGARRLLGSALGSTRTVDLRLQQAGWSVSVDAFRAQQLAWAVCGAGFGAAAASALVVLKGMPVPVASLGVVVSAGCAILACDYRLQRAATRRMRRLTAELPTTLEFLTLSLSAGEGILDAVRRIAVIGRGELAGELAVVVAAVGTGLPLAESLSSMAARLELPALSRCVDQIVGTLERGTPLAEVLRAQAQDARDDAKRALLELSGKKEVAMMVPLVFLILPVTILFAIFPGIFVLQLGI